MALIENALVVARILRHLGLPTDRPEFRPARSRPSRGFSAKRASLLKTSLAFGVPLGSVQESTDRAELRFSSRRDREVDGV